MYASATIQPTFDGHSDRTVISKTYLPVGLCIYCGTTEPPLSDEHIIPYALGGKLILPTASCDECAKVTSQVEQQNLRGIYWPSRTHMKLPTRRPRERPKTFEVSVEKDGVEVVKDLPIADHPGLHMAFDFDPPHALYGLPPLGMVRTGRLSLRPIAEDNERRLARLGGRVTMRAGRVGYDAPTFARMLAKTGHAYATAELGVGAFHPLLLDAILRNDLSQLAWLVGGKPSVVPGEGRHRITVDIRRVEVGRYSWKSYVVVDLSLFTDLEMPTYTIVAGEVRP